MGGYYDTAPTRHVIPSRRDVLATPRSSGSSLGPIVTETVYKVPKIDTPARRGSRDSSRTRRSTLDGQLRPKIVMQEVPKPRHSHAHGQGRPASPVQNPFRSSDEGGEYYTIPASSRGQRRQTYSTTKDDSDLYRQSKERENGNDRLLRTGTQRNGATYAGGSRSRQSYHGISSRRDEDYRDDYEYTKPGEAQYDLNLTQEPRQRSRRDSYEGPRPARPSSASGYKDVIQRSYDAREKGPPPSSSAYSRAPVRPVYDAPPTVRMPLPPGPNDISSREPFYEVEPPRRTDSRSGRRERPVTLYHEHDRRRSTRDEDPRDDDLRYRREKPQPAPRYGDNVEGRGFGIRAEPRDDVGFEKKKERTHDRKDSYDDYDDRDRKGSRSNRLDDDNDRDRKGSRSNRLNEDEDRDRKSRGGKMAAAAGIAGAALGINAAAKSRDDDDDESDKHRRRRDED
jgi:hypothetical protein